jgi:hypothetical protein
MGISDQEKEFTIELAAKLMAGGIEAQDIDKLFEDELKCLKKRLLDAYAIAVRSYQKMFENDDSTTYQEQNSAGAIKSVRMQACERIAKVDPKWSTMHEWLKSSLATLEHQLFEREELGRWINENNISSRYQFIATPAGKAPAANGTTKRWDEKALFELKLYRETHTEKETSAQFIVSGQRVRLLLKKYRDSKIQKGTVFKSGRPSN